MVWLLLLLLLRPRGRTLQVVSHFGVPLLLLSKTPNYYSRILWDLGSFFVVGFYVAR